MEKYDFSGWATRHNIKCSDGRTITKDAFKHCDGMTVPLCWGHCHDDPTRVLGHALLEYRDEGVYTYGKFNDTEQGQNAKRLVDHGDVVALSIYANKLKQQRTSNGADVLHGDIREVSLVLAGANPEAFIDSVIRHSEDGTPVVIEDEGIIYTGENIELSHADDNKETKKEETPVADEKKDEKSEGKSYKEVFESMNEEQQALVFMVAENAVNEATKENKEDVKHDDLNEGGNNTMKTNVFDQSAEQKKTVLTHADEEKIVALAKTSAVGSLQAAIKSYVENNTDLAHSFSEEDLTTLFPEFKNINPGEPEMLTRDQGWVGVVMKGVRKSPFSRIRTRKADARIAELRAKGYKKGEQKTLMANIKLLGRTTEPQTIYIKDELNRDDIVDITDFSIVDFEKKVMRMTLDEEVATAIMLGDGRDDGDPDKIHDDRIRPIWTDDDLYTIHADVDVAKMKNELQGTDTDVYFGENYIYAESIVQTALYARENFKGSGTPDFFCEPHLVNVMLLARDRDGRRIYNNKSDLAAALNVKAIYECEQFAGKTRTDKDGNTKKLLGIFVNLNDYQVGATKGGEITSFNQFDIDFNKEKFLMECRLSGALTDPYSAIALEELVEVAEG